MPVFIGGNNFRWIGIYLLRNGHVGLKFNNSGLLDCGSEYQIGQWHTGMITHDSNLAHLYLDGNLICNADRRKTGFFRNIPGYYFLYSLDILPVGRPTYHRRIKNPHSQVMGE